MVDCTACSKPNIKLGFRGVRTSKFRHIFGQPARKELCYDNIKITKNAHDCNFCAVNPKFLAIVTEVAGGGSFLVLPLEKVGRIEYHNAYKVTGHAGPVLDVKWNPFNDNIIASCSDDATIKLWHIQDGGLTSNLTDWLVDLTGHKRRVGFIEWHPTAENILASVGFDYLVVIWHVSKAEIISVIECHSDIIYSLSFNREGSLLATTCKDKKLRVIEPRSGRVVNEGMCHLGTKASKVVFLGDSERLLTTGFARYSDRQFAIWNQNDLSKPLMIETIDSSSGVLFPYYDHDTRVLYLAGKGDGNIRYYEMVDHAPWAHYLNQFLSGSPQRGLGWMPKRGCEVLRCEVGRFYKLHAIKGLCEPISMIVPRKSDQFQEDIFPDTLAPNPALSALDWIKGIDRPPLLISLRTGVVIKTHRPITYKANDFSSGTPDRNSEKKFAFLAQETVPDYRTLEAREKDTKDKWEKTRMNQAVQQRKVASIISQLQNTGSAPNLASAAPNAKPESKLEKEKSSDIGEISSIDDYRRAYMRKCFEVERLQLMVAVREKRIQELESHIELLSGGKLPQPSYDNVIMQHKFRSDITKAL